MVFLNNKTQGCGAEGARLRALASGVEVEFTTFGFICYKPQNKPHIANRETRFFSSFLGGAEAVFKLLGQKNQHFAPAPELCGFAIPLEQLDNSGLPAA